MKKYSEKSKGKDHHWDERFWLGRIPDVFGDPPAVRRPSTNGKPRRRDAHTRGVQPAAVRSGSKPLDKTVLVRYIENEWEERGVPEYFRAVYRETLLECNSFHTEVVLKKELEDLMSGDSLLLRALEAVNAREDSLKGILEINSYLRHARNWLGLPQALEDSQTLLQAYRTATLAAIECIYKWQESIAWFTQLNTGVQPSKKVVFLWNHQNYLAKMRTDANFLAHSELAKAYKFVQEDPLLILADSDHAPVSLPIQSEYIKSIDDAHCLLFKGQRLVKESLLVSYSQNDHAVFLSIAKDLIDTELLRAGKESARRAYAEAINDPQLLSPLIYNDFLDKSVLRMVIDVFDEFSYEDIAAELIGRCAAQCVQETAESYALDNTNAMAQVILDQLLRTDDVAHIARTVLVEACYNDIVGQLSAAFVDEGSAALQNEVILEVLNQETDDSVNALANIILHELLEFEEVDQIARTVYTQAFTAQNEQKLAILEKEANENALAQLVLDDLLLEYAHELIQEITQKFHAQAEPNVKAEKLQCHQLAEALYRQLLEKILNETNIEDLAQTWLSQVIFRRRTLTNKSQEQARLAAKELELENESLAKAITAELIEDFLDANWVFELASFILEHEFMRQKTHLEISIDPEDDALELFTPHIHSPVAYSVVSSAAERQSEAAFAVGTDFTSVKGVEFEPVRASLSALTSEMAEYFAIVPTDIASVLLPEDVLESTCLEGNDSSWFYGMLDGKIVGMLIYSIDPTSLYQRRLGVLHISCLNLRCFGEFIEEACKFLWQTDHCQEIRVHLYSPVSGDINRPVKAVFNSLKFRWKTEQLVPDGKLTVMGISRPNQQLAALTAPPVSISAQTTLAVSDEQKLTGADEESMARSGLRQSLVTAVLGFFPQLSKGNMKIGENQGHRLQTTIDWALQKVKQTNRFELPYTETAGDYPASQASVNFHMNWVGCTHISRAVSRIQYKYLRLRSARLKHLETDHQHLYMLPTSVDGVTALFVKGRCQRLWLDLRNQSIDLAEWVAGLRSVAWESEEECTALLTPVFSVEAESAVPWMLGYCIPNQTEESRSAYVSEATQKVDVRMTAYAQSAGAFLGDTIREQVIEEDFIFGLLHSEVDRDLGVPILTVLVQRNDWQLAL